MTSFLKDQNPNPNKNLPGNSFQSSPNIIENIDAEVVRDAVKSGEFFAHSFDWFFFRYVKQFHERSLLLVFAIAAIFVLSELRGLLKTAFPLVVSKPIFVPAKEYPIKLIKLRYKPNEKNYDPDIKTVDDAILKYLIKNYVIDREGFDFSSGEIEEVNDKIARLKNRSTDVEFNKFYEVMDEKNPKSSINFFGKRARKFVNIDSVKFNRLESNGFSQRFVNYFQNELPLDAEVKFTTNLILLTDDGRKLSNEQKFRLQIGYEYEPIKINSKNREKTQKTLKFIVRKYDLSEIK